MIFLRAVYCFCLIFFFYSSYGQIERFEFHHLSLTENLNSQNFNFYINKDKNNFIWISSSEGVNRFDGLEITQYLPSWKNKNGLMDGIILSNFFQDLDENMWFSSTQAIYKYDTNTDIFIPHWINVDKKKLEGPYYLMHIDTITQSLWVRINQKLYIIPNYDFNNSKFLGEYPLFFGSRIVKREANNNLLCFITQRNGFSYLEFNGNGTLINKAQLLEGYSTTSFFYDGNETIFVGTNNGLIKKKLTDKSYKVISSKNKDIINIVDIQPLNSESIVIATIHNGIFIYNMLNNVFSKIYTSEKGQLRPFDLQIEKINITNEILWISTFGKGIYYTNLFKKEFKIILEKSSANPSGNYIKAITEDKDENLWILTEKNIKLIDKEGNKIKIMEGFKNSEKPFFGKYPNDIFIDSENWSWVASQDGLYFSTSENQNFQKIKINKEKANLPIYKITQLKNGKVLVSTLNGVYEVDKKKLEINLLEGLEKHKTLFSWIVEPMAKDIIILRKEDEGFLVAKKINDSLVIDSTIPFKHFINDIWLDNDSTFFWLASSIGLFKLVFQSNKYQIIPDSAFSSVSVKGVIQIPNSKILWLSTNQGIIKYNPSNKKTSTFNVSDGIPITEFNFWSSLKTKSNKIIFGSTNGLIMFDPMLIKLDSVEVTPTITSLLINDAKPKEKLICEKSNVSSIPKLKSITQTYQNNTLSFRFAALDYTDPNANEFKYRITPIEKEWVHSGTENFARYANLAPGNYTFEVDATNSDGIWSNNPAKLDITILPPWWETWWFRTLATLAIAGIIYLIYQNRVQQIQKEADFKRKEAEYKQLAAETETAVLRLQMNPHFIFNSMNSISSYLLQKDIETANDYLGRFARLMRKILMVAEEPYLSVYDEIELLEQYMQAEAMRFEEKFQYEFVIDEAIDTDEVLIPTMILQPFVENAIWHGISNIKGLGRIIIEFKLTKEKFICTIEDNGVGRKAASQKKSTEHESKATIITKRRLKLLATENYLDFEPSLAYQDLVDSKDQPIGTKVILELPLI